MSCHDDHLFALASALRKAGFRRKPCRPHARQKKDGLPAAKVNVSMTGRRSPTQVMGDHYEAWAARLLTESGCQILARQLRCRFGEIDLVVRQGSILVFVEVRSCRNTRYGGAAASVDHAKQKRIILTARWWLNALRRDHFGGKLPPCRFDLIAFESDTPIWIRDAFCIT